MRTIQSDRTVMVDCDDTLVLWDKSEFPMEEFIEIECYGTSAVVVPHRKNLNTLLKFHKLGYRIVVWSASGWEWAENVVKALKLEDIVDTCMSKPRYYFDDLPCQEWMGPRIWRDPKSGEE
jgi:FMN phosphatase YigB (HAD superfamily)